MTTLENDIVAKFHSEILAAEATARGPIIDSLYSFLGVIEKRIALTVAEVKPAGVGALSGAASSNLFQRALLGVETEGAKIEGEAKSFFGGSASSPALSPVMETPVSSAP